MELLDKIALILGYLVMVGVGVLIVAIVLEQIVSYRNDHEFFTLTIFKFGVVYARSEQAQWKIEAYRPSAKGKRVHFSAPMWFNKIFNNVGGREV
jgi:hypothetical protein